MSGHGANTTQIVQDGERRGDQKSTTWNVKMLVVHVGDNLSANLQKKSFHPYFVDGKDSLDLDSKRMGEVGASGNVGIRGHCRSGNNRRLVW